MATRYHDLRPDSFECRRCGQLVLNSLELCTGESLLSAVFKLPSAIGEKPAGPKVVELERNPTLDKALEAVELLRAKVASGEVIAFIAVGIMDDDTIEGFVGSSKPVTRLRMHGALAALGHDVLDGKL